MKQVDFLVVGQGLAGSALALRLLELGASVLVADRGDPDSATRVAAGLVTTIAGRSMNASWEQESYLAEALQFYHHLEQQVGEPLFHPARIERGFVDEKQRAKWQAKAADLDDWVEGALAQSERWPYGGIALRPALCGDLTQAGAGWLDTKKYLETVRQELGEYHITAELREEELEWLNGRVVWRGNGQMWSFRKVIFCRGAAGLLSGAFSYLKHRSAKGEILTVQTPSPPEHILSSNGWVVPIGGDLCRVGASYEWDELNTVPTATARAELLGKLRQLGIDCAAVVRHEAAVRPIIRNSQPVYLEHPERQGLGLFNGLGSKGVTYAPKVARLIAEHLVEGAPLPKWLSVSS